MLVNDKLISSFVEKANNFNDFFGRQCQPMSSDSTVPLTFSFEATNRLSNVNIRPEKISKIIQTSDQNKDHEHDGIFVRMTKICESSIIKPLQLLFNNCVKQGVFPNIWKMATNLGFGLMTPVYTNL